MAFLVLQGTLGHKVLLVHKVPKVCLESLARMASAGFQALLGHSVILVILDCKAPQDLKELQGSQAPLGALGGLGTAQEWATHW